MSFHCRDFSLRFCTVQHDFSFVESTVLLHLTSVDRHVLLPAMVGELVTFSTSGAGLCQNRRYCYQRKPYSKEPGCHLRPAYVLRSAYRQCGEAMHGYSAVPESRQTRSAGRGAAPYSGRTCYVVDPLLCICVWGDQRAANSENPKMYQLLCQSSIWKT